MKRIVKALLNAALTFIAFTVIPLIVPRLLPRELLVLLSQSSIDIIGLFNEIAIIGVILTIISFLKGLFDEASPVNLVVSVASNVAWLILIFVFLGFGSIERLGLVEVTSRGPQATNTAIVDIRFFVYLALVGTALKVAQSVFKFREARKAKKLVAEKLNVQYQSTVQEQPKDQV